jgi:nucleoid DNA-binding protein
LRPDRWDKVIDRIHEETGYDKKFIKDFMKFYWKKVREAIMGSKHYRIKVLGFGVINMREKKALELRQRYLDMIKNCEVNTLIRYKHKSAIEQSLARLDHALEFMKKDKEKFKQIAIKRYGKYTPRVEQQEFYLRRNKE